MLTRTPRHNKLGSSCDGRKAAKDNRKFRRLVTTHHLSFDGRLSDIQARAPRLPSSHLPKMANDLSAFLLNDKLS
jgi:hypothetical protein